MSHPIIIEQIAGSPRRRVVLERSALPEGEFVREIGLRVERTEYPGARGATLQVLGVSDKPIKLAGKVWDSRAGVDGFGDALRSAIEGLVEDGRLCRLSYRTVAVDGLCKGLVWGEKTPHRQRYEFEFEVAGPSSVKPASAEDRDTFDIYNEMANCLAEIVIAWDFLPDEIRTPPPEWEEDPWLAFRLAMEEVHRRIRFLLELTGNEKLLNLDDRVTAATRAGWTAVNTARTALDEWDGSALGLADQLTQGRNVLGMMDSLDTLGGALR